MRSDLPEEVQMVIPSPADANQLIIFVSRVEKLFQSRVLQMVGSWKGDTAITIGLPEPSPIADILNDLGKLSEIETIEEKPPTGEVDPSLFKKVSAIPRPKIKARKTVFVTLKKSRVEEYAA